LLFLQEEEKVRKQNTGVLCRVKKEQAAIASLVTFLLPLVKMRYEQFLLSNMNGFVITRNIMACSNPCCIIFVPKNLRDKIKNTQMKNEKRFSAI